jgi:hypothetical protein
MKLNWKITLTLVIAAALISSCTTYAFLKFMPHHNSHAYANIYAIMETSHGTDVTYIGNIILDRFEKKVANLFGFDNDTLYAYTYIALGNSTVSQTLNKLDTEATTTGFARANSTVLRWIYDGDYALNFTRKFTATGDITINATALCETGAGEATDAVCIASLGESKVFENHWNYTIVWTYVWDLND